MYRHWFDKLLARLSTPRPVTSARRRPSARPHIESLESRCLLSMNAYYDGRVVYVDTDMQPPYGVPISVRHFTDKTAIIGVEYVEFYDMTFDSLVINTSDSLGPITLIGVGKPTTINILAGHIPVTVGRGDEPLDLEAPVSINAQGGTTDVAYDDQGARSISNPVYTLSASGNAGLGQRSGLGDVSYSGISCLTVSTATGTGARINILGTAVATPTTVYDDAVLTTINVGAPSQLLVLNSPLTVSGDEFASVSYNDQANPTPAGLTYTVSANRVQRNGLADLNFGGSIGTVAVNTGFVGNQTVNVLSQDDLLIAGSTIYDTEAGLASWLQIAAYWAGTDGYFTRVTNLTSGNGVPLLDATTVLGNGGGNVLNGNGELALLFSDGLDAIAGFDPNSQTIAINP